MVNFQSWTSVESSKNNVSSNINEVIRAVLNSFFFYKKILHAPKAPKAPKGPQAQKHKNATKQKHKTLQANKNKKRA